ncbi:MAG TPA: ABC transporter ATP-binding protein [Anaeromyxobacteraceae bacterium]|nr:ABC transporter ATP-binding protein [Anaeromyxobacteraceae bacterium]
MIELRDVRKVFHQGRPDEMIAVDGLSLRVQAGALTVFRGPSGSGKTTLLSLVGCMARPSSGRIFVRGREVTRLPERFLADVRRRTFGFVFEHFHLVPGLNALENVMLPAYPLGERRSELARRARGLLESLGVGHRAAARIDRLASGEAQRVAVARALVNDPDVIVADEPTAHLDTRVSRELLGILAGLRDRGKTVLLASHDPLVTESPLVDRVVALRDGRIEGAR